MGMHRRLTVQAQTLAGLLLALTFAGGGRADPTITRELTVAENRPTDDIFGLPGLMLTTSVTVSDTLGNAALTGAGASARVAASNAAFPFTNPAALSFVPVGTSGGYFIRLFPITTANFPQLTGTYQYTVTDTANVTAGQTSHNVHSLEAILLPTNLAVSDFTTTPAFSWTDPSPTPGVGGVVRVYDAVVYDSQMRQVAILPSPTTANTSPSITIPAGLLTPGQQYYLRAQNVDVDSTAPFAAESIGEEFLSFTPVPEPGSLVLLAAVALPAWCARRCLRQRYGGPTSKPARSAVPSPPSAATA